MPFSEELKTSIYDYCNNHLPGDDWYLEEFDFIEDLVLRKRIIEEFKGIRFAYKLYEGLDAIDENLIFEVRSQILAYASIFEAVIHYILYKYYKETPEFHSLQYHTVPTKMGYGEKRIDDVKRVLSWKGGELYIFHDQERKKDETQVRFDEKCKAAEALGLLHTFTNDQGETIDLPSEIISIYGYRNAIHLIAERRKGISYELELSKKAYLRMRPFVDQIKSGLKRDHKGIYATKEE